MIVYQDMPSDRAEVPRFVADVVAEHVRGPLYRTALVADEYYAQRNVTVRELSRVFYGADGRAFEDFTASRMRIASNIFKRLNVQRCMYSLGNGVTFVGDAERGDTAVKDSLGPRFDDDLKAIGVRALIHGVAFAMWNLDHVEVFPVTQFAPVYDERTGALMAGVRFWRLDASRPMTCVLYEADGYTEFATQGGGSDLRETHPKRAYKTTYSEVPALGVVESAGENYGSLPIVPVWGGDARQSTLVGLREAIDAYDLIKSGLANDVQDCAEVYWIVENAGGMTDEDLQRYRDRLRLTHIATADTYDGGRVVPYTQDVPTSARRETLRSIREDIYEDFGALDVHSVAAGATNDHVDAAYQPMDEEADEFERHIRDGVRDLLALQGVEDTPVFRRNRISNRKEQAEIVAIEAAWLDRETILRKLPNIEPQEVSAIMERLEAEEAEAFGSSAPDDDAGALVGGEEGEGLR